MRREVTRDPSARTEEKKNRQMPGRSGVSEGQVKDGPDPTFNPCSFPFVWSHIWARFPPARRAGRKSSGWVKGGSGLLLLPQSLLPSRVNRQREKNKTKQNTQIKKNPQFWSQIKLQPSQRWNDRSLCTVTPSQDEQCKQGFRDGWLGWVLDIGVLNSRLNAVDSHNNVAPPWTGTVAKYWSNVKRKRETAHYFANRREKMCLHLLLNKLSPGVVGRNIL